MAISEKTQDGLVRVRTWDSPVRIIHWALVLTIAFSWWSAEQRQMEWHMYSGYTIFALVLFRIFWGFVGSETARFKSFLRGPGEVIRYLKKLRSSERHSEPGHNPLGGWSVVLLLLVTTIQVGTGLFAVDIDGIDSGPLSDRVEFDTGRLFAEVHETAFLVLQILIIVHLCAIVFYILVKRENLVSAMISGYRRLTPSDRPQPVFATGWRMVIGILIAGATVYAFSRGLRF